MFDEAVLIAEQATNRPLAMGTIVVSVLLIVVGVLWRARNHRRRRVMQADLDSALETVDWYATEVGEELRGAPAQQRSGLLDTSSDRIGGAHQELIDLTLGEDDQAWNDLMAALTGAESAYRDFAAGEQSDPGRVAEHQRLLREATRRYRESR